MNENTQASAAAPLKVHNGTFTVESPKSGHFTVKLYTAQEGQLAGRRILALLTGPDNVSDYRGVAFWNDDEGVAHVWTRYCSPGRDRRAFPINGFHWGDAWTSIEKKLAVWADLAVRGATDERHGYWFEEGYRLLHEGRCVVCNRPLTDPESIRLGIGPTCGGRA